MRKIILLCAVLVFTSCGGDPEEPECQICDYDGGGQITLCNNLNGTATVTLPGEAPEEVNLNGISFQSYISNLESQGIISCD